MKHSPGNLKNLRILLVLCALSTVLAGVADAQQFSTTTVQGTVYQANGKPGSGTLQLSWPAFTTAANQAVAAGRTSIPIGNDGFLSVNVAPNVGSTPAGLFYTAVYHLSDGTTSTEYWVVPAAAQATIAQVRAQVMPAAQAVQAVSKTYVDQSIQQLTQSLLTSSGGNLTGPLYLSGDPTMPNQAATKHYVDNEFSQTLSNNGGVVTGPLTATRIGAAYQADQFAGSDFGAQLQACINALDSTYGGTCDARNFYGNLAMASNLVIGTANVTVELPCATISTAAQILVTAGTRNVTLHGCASRGTSASSGSQGGTVFLSSGAGALIHVGDATYAADTLGFHLDNVAINTTSASASTAQALAIYRTQELNLSSLYLLGNTNQTGITLDGTGNYAGGTVQDAELVGFKTAINAIGHQTNNAAPTDWLNASTFVRLHIVCPTQNGSPIAGTVGINLQQGDGNTFTGGDVESCATALHLGPNAQNNTIVGLRNENSTYQVVADAGSAYNNWMTGGTMFTGKLSDSGTRNSFLDTFHRSFNALNGDWFGTQQDATLTNHYRLGIGSGNERGLLHRYQTDAGYRWTMGLSDATSGAQFYQVLDELNNVYRLSIGQYNSGQASTNNQTVINAAGTGAVVINGSTNAGTGGVVIGSGGASGAAVATINNAGNAQFNGSLQVAGASTFQNSTTVKNGADTEIDAFLWAGATAPQKESFIYKDWNGASQWYLVKDASNNWALNSALGGLDSFKAYQSTNSGDTYINAAKSSGAVRVNYETGSGTAFNIYGGNSGSLYASFSGSNSIKFPGLAAAADRYCLQVDNSGYLSNTGAPCGTGSGGGGGDDVSAGRAGQIAYYATDGKTLAAISTVPVAAGGTGASTSQDALTALGALPTAGGTLTGQISGPAASFTGSVAAGAVSQTGGSPGPAAPATAVATMYNLQGLYKGQWWQNVTYGYGDIVTTACGSYISTAYPNINAQPNAYPNSWVPLGGGCTGSISGVTNLNATLMSNGFYIYDSRNNGTLGRQTFLSGEYNTAGNTMLRTSAQLFLDGWGSGDSAHSAVSSTNIWSPPGGGTNMIWAIRTGYWDTVSGTAKNQRWFENDANIGSAPITGIARTWGYDSSSLPYTDVYNYPPGSTLKYQNLSSVAVSTTCPSGAPLGSVCMNGQAYSPVTVATLPAATAANKNVTMMVSDGANSGDCATGGGSSQAMCTSNGTAWSALGSGAVFPATTGPVCNTSTAASSTCSSTALQTAIGAGAYDAAGAATTAQAASLQKISNLSDLANAATARTNLGLGTAATQDTVAFDASGAAAAAQAASIPVTQRGAANGVATLDGSGLVPVNQERISSVNGKTGAVTLNAYDVGAVNGLIAGTSAWTGGYVGSAAVNALQSRIPFVPAVDSSCIRVAWDNAENNSEMAGPQLTLKASIEYPYGTYSPIFFNGARTTTLEPKGTVVSDPVCVDVPGGKVFYVRSLMVKTNPADSTAFVFNYQSGVLASGTGYMGAGNTDASGQFDGAEYLTLGTFADGVTNGTTTFTTGGSTPFNAGSVGNVVNVCSTNFTVSAFTNTSTVTLSGSPNCGSGQTFSTSMTDKTLAGTIQYQTAFQAHAPLAVFGIAKGTPKGVVLLGDSITAGTGACGIGNGGTGCTGHPRLGSWAVQALSQANIGAGYDVNYVPNIPYLSIAMGGESLSNLIGQHHVVRYSFLGNAKKALGDIGINDITGGQTAAQMETNYLILWGQFAARGLQSYYATLTPKTTSIDGWLTASGQTVTAQESVRLAINAWLRDGAPMDCATSDYQHNTYAPAATGSSANTVVRANYYSNGGLTTPATSGSAATCTHPINGGGLFELADAVEVNSSNVPTRNGGLWKVDANVRVVTGCSAAAGSNVTITCTGTPFTSADSGRVATLMGAGASGANLTVTSLTYLTTSTVRMTTQTAVSNANLIIDGGVINNTTGAYTNNDGLHPSIHGHFVMGQMAAANVVSQWTW